MATVSPRVVRVGDQMISYSVRRSRKASRWSLQVTPGTGLEVVIPFRESGRDVERVIAEKAAWIVRRFERLERLEREMPIVPLVDGTSLKLMGFEHTLKVRKRNVSRGRVTRLGSELRISTAEAGGQEVSALLERWCLGFARRALPARAEELNAIWKCRYRQIRVRSQRARWGSCSSDGTLNFNWRVILLPPGVIDYLIAHEFAHLREMNHSARFWLTVEELYPAYDEAERWLKGRETLLLGPTALMRAAGAARSESGRPPSAAHEQCVDRDLHGRTHTSAT